jgi:hypothetical protein
MNEQIKLIFREHPTLLLTFCYFVITIIGVLYSYFFYQEFGINIIKFADLSDFLLASILEPKSVIIFISLIFITYFLYWFDFLLRKKYKGYGNFVEKKFKSKYTDPIGYIFILVFYTTFLVQSIAIRNAEEVKAGKTDDFVVRISDPGEHQAETNLALLGSSSRYLYLFNNKKSEAQVIPVENVSFMIKKVVIAEQNK